MRAFNCLMRELRLSGFPVILIAVVFSLLIWSRASAFGSPAECNPQTVIVIIGSKLSAITSGRKAGLVTSSVMLFYLLLFATSTYRPLPSPRHISKDSDSVPRAESTSNRLTLRSLFLNVVVKTQITPRPEDSSSTRDLKYAIRYMGLSWAIITSAMFILSNELTIRANSHLLTDVTEARNWTLAQVRNIYLLLRSSKQYTLTYYYFFCSPRFFLSS